jgi:signal transduction histidine kinase/tetratricopeptide (TPR) repeat protein
LVDQVFLLYSNEKPFFPLFQNRFDTLPKSAEPTFDTFQLNTIRLAEDLEFRQKKYNDAISNYYKLLNYSKDKTAKARALNSIARNWLKLQDFNHALEVSLKIINEFPDMYSADGLQIFLYAKLLAVECYQKSDEPEKAIESAMVLYNELLTAGWDLSEDRFNTFIGLTTDALNKLFAEETALKSKYMNEMNELGKRYEQKTAEWKNINILKSIIIPDLTKYAQENSIQSSPFRKLNTVGGQNFLILGAMLPEKDNAQNSGILGVTLDNKYLENDLLINAIENIRAFKNTTVCITNLSGHIITGNKTEDPGLIKTIAFFDNKFPPWQIELGYTGSKGTGGDSIFSNFFFWTIITLIVILVFGTTLIVRITVREMELLKLKSDFVSSVSHEFKTPLTSMKALTERIEGGKVTQPEKLRQYLSLISFDIERLIRLVGNILNFSKIEEGKKVYKMEKTDTGLWLKQVIDNFSKENFENNVAIRTHIAAELPFLLMDTDAMAQAIFNLLDNAVKFSPGNKDIEFTAEKKDKTIIMNIKDKGIGIEKDESDKILEKFYRGKSAVNNSIRGTGLGLTLVKYTIDAHGGKVKVGSEPGWSTVITIILPI